MLFKLESSTDKQRRRRGVETDVRKNKTYGRSYKGQLAKSGGKFVLFESG
ncbi:MAG: hypothetical protein ACTS4V_00105 [Candidatus Hodgkinia cicadicola]